MGVGVGLRVGASFLQRSVKGRLCVRCALRGRVEQPCRPQMVAVAGVKMGQRAVPVGPVALGTLEPPGCGEAQEERVLLPGKRPRSTGTVRGGVQKLWQRTRRTKCWNCILPKGRGRAEGQAGGGPRWAERFGGLAERRILGPEGRTSGDRGGYLGGQPHGWGLGSRRRGSRVAFGVARVSRSP